MSKYILTQYDADEQDFVEVFSKDENKAMSEVLRRVNAPKTKLPRKKVETAALTLRQDNPGGKWLENKLKDPSVHELNAKGAPERFGEDTATFNESVLLPVKLLQGLPGCRGEQNFVREDDYASLYKYMSENNKLPPPYDGSPKQYAPFLQINFEGKAWVNEGNHRIKVAKALGWEYLLVDVQYHLGGEDVSTGDFAPAKVKAHTARAVSKGYDIKNFRGDLKGSE